MTFTDQQYFHIYSRGNNRRRIFFSEANYRFFLWRMRGYLLPFGDLVAYALMTNHFHWLFYVHAQEIDRRTFYAPCDAVENARRRAKCGDGYIPVGPRSTRQLQSTITLNRTTGTFLGGLRAGHQQAAKLDRFLIS